MNKKLYAIASALVLMVSSGGSAMYAGEYDAGLEAANYAAETMPE